MRRVLFLLLIIVSLAAVAASAQSTNPTTSQKARVSKTSTPSAPVNLNSATVAQLDGLPGVGRSTAQRIVDYRQKNGNFKKIEELMNVKGIGEKSFLKLKPLITVGGDRAENAAPQK